MSIYTYIYVCIYVRLIYREKGLGRGRRGARPPAEELWEWARVGLPAKGPWGERWDRLPRGLAKKG